MGGMSCGSCGADSEDYLCWTCLGSLRKVILGLQEAIVELQTQVTKQDKGAPSVGGSHVYEWSIPFSVEASHTADEVLRVLVKWNLKEPERPKTVSLLKKPHLTLSFDDILFAYFVGVSVRSWSGLELDEALHGRDEAAPIQRAKRLAEWHLKEYVRLGRLDTGPQMFAEMKEVLSRSEAVIDRKEVKVWIGDCECGRSVRSLPRKKSILCPCGKLWDVQEARDALKTLGAEQVVSASDAASLGDIYGTRINPTTIRVWRHRGKLQCLSPNCGKGCSHVYRFGDILNLHQGKQEEFES